MDGSLSTHAREEDFSTLQFWRRACRKGLGCGEGPPLMSLGIMFFCQSRCPGGHFPDDLRALFPWEAFFLGTQRDYLMKEASSSVKPEISSLSTKSVLVSFSLFACTEQRSSPLAEPSSNWECLLGIQSVTFHRGIGCRSSWSRGQISLLGSHGRSRVTCHANP